MATRVISIVSDDIDGSEAAETITFSWRGRAYEIDLSKAHVDKFDEMMRTLIEHARRVAGGGVAPVRSRRAAASVGSTTSGPQENRAIREWAERNQIPVAPQGRIKREIVDRYRAEQSGEGSEAAVAPVETAVEPELAAPSSEPPVARDTSGYTRTEVLPDDKTIREWLTKNRSDLPVSKAGKLRQEFKDVYARANGILVAGDEALPGPDGAGTSVGERVRVSGAAPRQRSGNAAAPAKKTAAKKARAGAR